MAYAPLPGQTDLYDYDPSNPLNAALNQAGQMGPLGPTNVPGIPPPIPGRRQPLPAIPNALPPLPNVLAPPRQGRRIDSGPQLFNEATTTPAGPSPVMSGFQNRFGYKMPENKWKAAAGSAFGTDYMDQIIANLGRMIGSGKSI